MKTEPHTIVVRGVRWHERNVLRLAIKFAKVFVTSPGYGGPVARAASLLNDGVEQLEAARNRAPKPEGTKQQ